MSRAFSEMRTKYQLLDSNKKDLNSALKNPTEYMEFIINLSSIIDNEFAYKFYISESRNFLMKEIINSNFVVPESIKHNENYILSELNDLAIYSKEELIELKEIYVNIVKEELDLPTFFKISQRESIDLDEMIKDNYFLMNILENFNNNLSNVESLKNNKQFLYTINILVNDYPDFFDKDKFNIIRWILSDANRNKFNSSLEYFNYLIYSNRTLNNLDNLEKGKIKRKKL